MRGGHDWPARKTVDAPGETVPAEFFLVFAQGLGWQPMPTDLGAAPISLGPESKLAALGQPAALGASSIVDSQAVRRVAPPEKPFHAH